MLAGPLVDQILGRVRDPQARITSRNFVRDRLADAQRLINTRFGFILDSATLTTEPLRIFYPVTALLAGAAWPQYVQQGERDLVKTAWKALWFMRRGWPRVVGPQYELWSLIGRDTIVVWPASTVSVALTVLSAKLTAGLANDDAELELPDDTLPMVVDLATVLVLLKARDYAPMAEAVASWKARVKERSVQPSVAS